MVYTHSQGRDSAEALPWRGLPKFSAVAFATASGPQKTWSVRVLADLQSHPCSGLGGRALNATEFATLCSPAGRADQERRVCLRFRPQAAKTASLIPTASGLHAISSAPTNAVNLPRDFC